MKSVRRMVGSVLLLASVVPLPAIAYTEVIGQLGSVQIDGAGAGAPGGYDFRVYLSTGGIICGGFNWAYVNVGESNYQAVVAGVLAAKALGSSVKLDVTPDGGTGYCHLAYVVVE
jgi:hypothetical protein